MPVLKTNVFGINLPPNNRQKHLVFISGVIALVGDLGGPAIGGTTEGDQWNREWYENEQCLVGPDWVNGSLTLNETLPLNLAVTPAVVVGSFDRQDDDPNGWAVDDWTIKIVNSDDRPNEAQKLQLIPKVAVQGHHSSLNRVSFFVAVKGTLYHPADLGL